MATGSGTVPVVMMSVNKLNTLSTNWRTIRIIYQLFFSRTSSPSYLLPEFPLDQNTNWICENCPHSFKQSKIEEISKILLDEKDEIHRSDITSLKIFMKKAEKQLHPHNYILSLTKRWLLPLMCSNPAKATYDEWIEKFHTGSDEIG